MFVKADGSSNEFFYRICSTPICHKTVGCKTNLQTFSCENCENKCELFKKELEDKKFYQMHRKGVLTYTMCEICLEHAIGPSKVLKPCFVKVHGTAA